MEGKTRLVKCTKEELEYLDPVMGQLSDGMWENSPRMEPYWICNSLTDEGIEMEPGNRTYGRRYYENPLYNMSDVEVKNWFATKLKAVVKQWLDDNGYGADDWNRTNTDEVSYLRTGQTVAGAYKAYDSLKGRESKVGQQVKIKEMKLVSKLEAGDLVGVRRVVQVVQPLTRRDTIVTIVYENDEVERLEAGKQVEVTNFKIIQ